MKQWIWIALLGVLALALAACAPVTMQDAGGAGASPLATPAAEEEGAATPDVLATPSADAATTPVMGATTSDSPTGGSDDDATTTDVTSAETNTGAGTTGTGTEGEAQTPATTETNEIILPDDAEMLVGVWQMGETAVRFDADGTLLIAGSAADLDGENAATGTWTLEGGTLTVLADDPARCNGEPGGYTVAFDEAGDTLRFTNVDDACQERIAGMVDMEVTRLNND